MSTSITVEFQVNDLDSEYEIIGTSDNYSFQENLGIGADLVLQEGDEFIKTIPLKGNYGLFNVRVFAVSNVGVRSPSLLGDIEVLPKELEDTFTFSQINLASEEDLGLNSFIVHSPEFPGDKLEVNKEFVGKSFDLNWSITPPAGHLLEGESLGQELINDSFFSGFKINLINDSEVIDLNSAGFSELSLNSLASTLSTDVDNVADILSEYKDFNISFDENVFNDLNLSRNVSLEIISVDKFGREATGIVNLSNPEPVLNNLTYSLKGSDVSFSWSASDVDFKTVNIEVLAIPEDQQLNYSSDLSSSAEELKKIKEAPEYKNYKNANFEAGDFALYEGKVYECIESHVRGVGENPTNSDKWSLLGEQIKYFHYVFNEGSDDEQLKLSQDSNNKDFLVENNRESIFKISQLWGYKYYYAFQPIDEYGDGQVYNLTKFGAIAKDEVDSDLYALSINLEIDNFRYREVNGEFVFNWDIVDQDGNSVDLSQHKFLFGETDFPSILGLSGSLFDVHSNQYLTGITQGNNSRSLDFDEDGRIVVNTNLPSTKVFDQYKYTRQINNQLYGVGGFPSDYADYDVNVNYESGENVLHDSKIYTSNQSNYNYSPNINPFYSGWSTSLNVDSSDTFVYKNNVYKAIDSFGPNSDNISGIFDNRLQYNIGDIVISAEKSINEFDEDLAYYVGDVVYYEGIIYECKKNIGQEEIILPNDTDNWKELNIFEGLPSAYYRSLSVANSSNPFDSSSWEKITPESLDANGEYFDLAIPSYEYSVSDWNLSASYNEGSLVIYENDIWSGTQASQGEIPSTTSQYWSNTSNSQDIGLYSDYYSRNYLSGDLVYSNNFVYKCVKDNPVAGPIIARSNAGQDILSNYDSTSWVPFWEINNNYDHLVFGHIGIPESGKRSVGLELGIVDKYGDIVNKKTLEADNPPPFILTEGFNVDSTSEATKVKFSFNYALGFQEKTTKVHLYRSTGDVFDITGADGLPYDKIPNLELGTNLDSTLVSITLGAEDAAFGENINQIIDEPPIPSIDGIEQITGYYYKILPFDEFGSGVLYNVPDGSVDQVLVYPKRYNSPNANDMPGRVFYSDPTIAAGTVPGKIIGFSGSTAFENYFLNWGAPQSDYDPNNPGKLLNWAENDIDHYEVWASEGEYIRSGVTESQAVNWLESENTGYRKIQGVAYSVGEIPQESPDPARYIYGAENIFTVPANSPSSEVVHPGQTNETLNFWIRAVDFAGNKSPFVGGVDPANINNSDPISGLTLTLGAAQATNIDGFESSITNKFYNTIALNPNNPFDDIQNGWDAHFLYHTGREYNISATGVGMSDGYIWWQTGNNYYNTGAIHPATKKEADSSFTDFNDGDFIIARVSNGVTTPVFHAFANALIGTANIENAAIISAKINDLSADKITAGEISSADIEISSSGNEAGVLRSVGFTGIDYENPQSGFVLSGDGTFAFQQGQGALTFDDDKLILYGGLRVNSEFDFDFVDIDLNPQFFTYHELQDGTFEPADDCPERINIRTTFRNSRVEASGVRFKMEAISGNQRYDVFDYNAHDSNGNYNNISGFTYINSNFQQGTEQKIASATFDLTGFSGILKDYDQVADSVVITAKSNKSELERSTTITRVIDGRAGDDGVDGANGADGADGVNARSVDLTAGTNIFTYNSQGLSPAPSSTTITATARNTSGTVFYKFLKNNTEVQHSTSPNYSYNAEANISSMPTQIEVEIREGSKTSNILSRNQISLGAVRPGLNGVDGLDGSDGVDAITTFYDNQSIAVPVSNLGVEDWTGTGGVLNVFDGTVELQLNSNSLSTSYPSSNGKYNINITKVSGDSLSGYSLSGAGSVGASIANFSGNLTQATQYLVSIYVKSLNGTQYNPRFKISIAPSFEGQDGENGQDGQDGAKGDTGNLGLSPTFRGVWNAQTQYINIPSSSPTDPGRGDIVYYNGSYYICIDDASGNSQDPSNTDYWTSFGGEFDSVATKLLLTEDAFITQKLELGVGGNALENPQSGVIVSAGFTGGLYDVYNDTYINSSTTYIKKLNCAYYNYDFDSNDLLYLGGVSLPNDDSSSTVDKVGWNDNTISISQAQYSSLPSMHRKVEMEGPMQPGQTPQEVMFLGKDQFTLETFYSNTPGFLLARPDDERVIFDMGGTGVLGNDSYIRFDSSKGKIEIAGTFINNTILAPNFNVDDIQFLDDPFGAFVGGGYNNFIGIDDQGNFNSLGSAITAGAWNTMESRFSFIGAGYSGDCRDNFSAIVAGYGNSMPLEEPGDHQGANFIGCGIENTISGGTSQAIVNGSNNKISQTGLINTPPLVDPKQSWLSPGFFGQVNGLGASNFISANFSATAPGWVENSWWPASGIQNWGPNNISGFSAEFYLGQARSLNTDRWIFHEDIGWCFIEHETDQLYKNSHLQLYPNLSHRGPFVQGFWMYMNNFNNEYKGWWWFNRNGVDDVNKHIVINHSVSGDYHLRNNVGNLQIKRQADSVWNDAK